MRLGIRRNLAPPRMPGDKGGITMKFFRKPQNRCVVCMHVSANRAYLTLLSIAAVLALAWAVPSTMAQDTRPEFVIAVLGDSYALNSSQSLLWSCIYVSDLPWTR